MSKLFREAYFVQLDELIVSWACLATLGDMAQIVCVARL
jgi:hypothetical protein